MYDFSDMYSQVLNTSMKDNAFLKISQCLTDTEVRSSVQSFSNKNSTCLHYSFTSSLPLYLLEHADGACLAAAHSCSLILQTDTTLQIQRQADGQSRKQHLYANAVEV